jgi:ABC-2 type transport system permease protein
MLSDIAVIMWKEFKELFTQRGRFRGGLVGMALFVVVFGIFMPLQTGRDWIETPVGLVYWSWVPFLLASSIVADLFAGERERHTLETLLASRLSDRAILLGKIGAAMAYAWGITVAGVLLGIVTVNIAFGKGELLFFPPVVAAGIFGLSFLVALLAAGLGVFVSLRAATVRQAQQTFSLAFFVVFIPLFLFPMLPLEWRLKMAQAVQNLNLTTALMAIFGVLGIADVLLVFAAERRFRRNRLILD